MFDWWKRARAPGEAAAPLYDAAVAAARDPAFYRAGGIEDTMDGRFAVLASVLALVHLRLEREGEAGNALGVALTERFIADMDSQMREAGFGDPSLGKQVRSLVGALAARIERLRGDEAWSEAAGWALYKDRPASAAGLDLLAVHRDRLAAATLAQMARGEW